jgi:hypothetical protein
MVLDQKVGAVLQHVTHRALAGRSWFLSLRFMLAKLTGASFLRSATTAKS